jgi:hypothetical protein
MEKLNDLKNFDSIMRIMMNPANIPKRRTMFIKRGQNYILQKYLYQANLPVNGTAYLAVSLST